MKVVFPNLFRAAAEKDSLISWRWSFTWRWPLREWEEEIDCLVWKHEPKGTLSGKSFLRVVHKNREIEVEPNMYRRWRTGNSRKTGQKFSDGNSRAVEFT
ncbi:hypothetical protein PIB30_002840 [Stylosanthes scabra]|uniref:Uncharacterized protein n=1 Tax=Stylosanthes scabra TaxID=79078 RepID=A0ABU6T4Y6_9FABA|nr:hypothetical protein [Stylosanthes scabra]